MSTLYRKYRPQDFTEVVGQEIIVQTLQNALASHSPAHGYLFTGPRGTGKTSLARIFAKALNCQDRKGAVACGKCAHCIAIAENQSLDIIEIDAASYTGVDNIRSLRETMNNAPLLGRYKIYIVDEVHMLSIGAFNALLKIIEEPPSHVIFLLATTELHKVPKTILSRVQRFDLRKFTLSEIVGKLERICKAEKIKIEAKAISLIAKNSGGALRDAESLLTQISTLANGPITVELVQTTLGIGNETVLYALLKSYTESDAEAVLIQIKGLEDSGRSPVPTTKDIVAIFRNILLFKAHKSFDVDPLSLLTDTEQIDTQELSEKLTYTTLTRILDALEEALLKMKGSAFGFLPLEIAFIQNLPTPVDSIDKPTNTPPTTPSSLPQSRKIVPSDSVKKESPEKSVSESTEAASPLPAVKKSALASVTLDTIRGEWGAITDKVKLLNASLSVALQSAKPIALKENTLHIAVKYKFHQERLNEGPHRLTLQEAFDTILGTHLAFCIVQEAKIEKTESKKDADPLVQHALELLGGSVL